MAVVKITLMQPESLSKQAKSRQQASISANTECEVSRAGRALMTAMRWAKAMEANSLSKADIARQEGISRARVTQLMSLLRLPEEAKADLLAGGPLTRGWSIKRAIRSARP